MCGYINGKYHSTSGLIEEDPVYDFRQGKADRGALFAKVSNVLIS